MLPENKNKIIALIVWIMEIQGSLQKAFSDRFHKFKHNPRLAVSWFDVFSGYMSECLSKYAANHSHYFQKESDSVLK